MNAPSLFQTEEETLRDAEELLASVDAPDKSWSSHYRDLTDKYRKLLSQFRRLVNIGDAMQNELSALNDQLTRSENKFRILFEQSRDAIFVTSGDGIFVHANQAFSDMFSFSLEEIPKTTFSDLWAEPDRKASWSENLEKTGYVQDFEWRARSKDGRIVDCLLTTTMGRAEDGTFLYQSICRDVTQQKMAREALRLSEAKYRLIFENSPVGIVHFDIQGTITACNSTAADMLGASRVLLIGQNLCVISKEDNVLTALRDAVSGKISHYEGYYTSAERKENSALRCAFAPIVAPDGSVVGCTGIFEDITERKRTERMLETTLRRFYTILSSVHAGILLVTEDGRIEFANQAFCNLFDLADLPSTLIGLHSSDMIQKIRDVYVSAEKAVARIQEIIAQQGPICAEEVGIRDGRTHLRDFIPILIDGKRYGRLWYHQDITDRKQAEEALRKSEELYRRIFENIEDVYFETGMDSEILQLSPSVERILGYMREEMIGLSDFYFYVMPEQKKLLLKKLRENGVVRDFEAQFRCKNGILRMCSINARLIYDEAGNPERSCGVLRDVTERRKAEDQIRASLEEKEVLLREIHHRVKNNFQIVAGLLTLQADHIPEEGLQTVLREAEARVIAMARVHEKLYHSEQLGEIRMDEYLSELAQELIGFHGQDNMRMIFKGNIESIAFDVDTAISCGLITTELVTNAIKHAFPHVQEGVVEIHLRAMHGDAYELTVRDNGIGLPADFILGKSESLGLKLVQEFAKRFGGQISLDRDNGTAIRIRFRRD
ncbi:MAG TPA: PAS domain S-box protein [Desulfomonilaceae bacterium]|nr:PAS domain S-box protein [Desulfomonilaceae bacterium]